MSDVGRAVAKSASPEPPFRHLIAEYVHRTRVVRCTCGYVGRSVATDGNRASEWDNHIRANRVVAG